MIRTPITCWEPAGPNLSTLSADSIPKVRLEIPGETLYAVTAPQLMAVAVAMMVAAAGCGMNSRTVTGTGIATQPSAASSRTGGIGSPVRDGAFEYAVLDVAHVHQVGDPKDPGLSITAKGVFVVVTLSIRNVGHADVTFFDNYQTLIDTSGNRYSASMAADIYGNLNIHSTKIAPGNELVVHIAFDVPLSTVPTNLSLRESSSSAGVTVPVS
jgi:hypothetical protein